MLGHEPGLVEEAVERICNIYLERASVYLFLSRTEKLTYLFQAIRNKTRHLSIHVVHPPDVQYALPEVMYDLQHLMIGREIMIRKADGWNGYPFALKSILIRSATFKLTRDSQGAPYSMEDLQDYRMRLRVTRDPWLCRQI